MKKRNSKDVAEGHEKTPRYSSDVYGKMIIVKGRKSTDAYVCLEGPAVLLVQYNLFQISPTMDNSLFVRFSSRPTGNNSGVAGFRVYKDSQRLAFESQSIPGLCSVTFVKTQRAVCAYGGGQRTASAGT